MKFKDVTGLFLYLLGALCLFTTPNEVEAQEWFTKDLSRSKVGVQNQTFRIALNVLASRQCSLLYVGNPGWATYSVSVRLVATADSPACVATQPGQVQVAAGVDGQLPMPPDFLPLISASDIDWRMYGWQWPPSSGGAPPPGQRRRQLLQDAGSNATTQAAALRAAKDTLMAAADRINAAVDMLHNSDSLDPGPSSTLGQWIQVAQLEDGGILLPPKYVREPSPDAASGQAYTTSAGNISLYFAPGADCARLQQVQGGVAVPLAGGDGASAQVMVMGPTASCYMTQTIVVVQTAACTSLGKGARKPASNMSTGYLEVTVGYAPFASCTG